MPDFLISDRITILHLNVIKTVTSILILFPVIQYCINTVQDTQGSNQIMFGFFALTLVISALILAFISALHISVWQADDLEFDTTEQKMLMLYRHVPILVFVGLIVGVVH